MKKNLTIILIMILVITSISSSIVFAKGDKHQLVIPKETKERLKNEDTYVLNRTRVIPSELTQSSPEIIYQKPFSKDSNQDDLGTFSIPIPYGEVDIIDTLGNESGYTTATNRSFSSFETFKYAAIKIIEKVPVIGDVFSTGVDIYDALKAVYSDLRTINGSKSVDVETRYAYRYFWHDLYVYDYIKTWKWVGESLSKYYYKHFAMFAFLDSVGEFRWRTYSFSHANGYDPEVIAKAPNYMKYSNLADIAYECWVYGKTYRETY